MVKIIVRTDALNRALFLLICKKGRISEWPISTIAELVSQIPVDTWNLLREIRQRRPAMMLSELIDYSKRVSQTRYARS